MTSDKRTPACRRLFSDADEATDDNHNTAAKELYMKEVDRFKDTWNFDPTTGQPLPGNYRWQDNSEEQEREEEEEEVEKEEEGAENDELKERRGRFESNVVETSRDAEEERNVFTSECESRTGKDSQPTSSSSTRVGSQPVIASLETESIDVKTSPVVTSLDVASADPAPLTVESRDTEASADWSKSSASASASDVIDQKSSSSTSSMTSVDESSSSEILPVMTSGTQTGDGDEGGDTRRRQREIKDYYPACKKFKAPRISSEDEDKESESRGPTGSLN